MAARCIILGDVMMDVTAVIDSDIAYASDTPARVSLQPGGVAANTVAWMALDGFRATIAGCVGADAFGLSIRRQLTELGVDVHLQQSARATGTCVVIVDRRRERTMFPDSGANADLDPAAVLDLITPGTHVHVSGYTLMNQATRAAGVAVLARATEVGATRSMDPATAGPLHAHLPFMRGLLPQIDLLLANEDEAAVLTGRDDPHEALESLADAVPCAVVKVGSRGVLARDVGMNVAAPPLMLDVVDTTGAGDAFTAGFLPAWLAGAPVQAAVDEGQRVAAKAVSRVGASPLVG